jgi:hypothetical protein
MKIQAGGQLRTRFDRAALGRITILEERAVLAPVVDGA